MKKFFAPIILLFSTDITTALALLENQPRFYWSQVKPTLRYIADAFTALGGGSTAVGTAVDAVVNGIGNEQIINWSDIKPILVTVNARLIVLGQTALGATIDAQLQQIPNENNQVYSSQIKPIFENISEALAALGQ
jgi:hypothetical protein